MIWRLEDLLRCAHENDAFIGGRYLPSRPYYPMLWGRLKAAWAVLCGRADAVVWPGGQ